MSTVTMSAARTVQISFRIPTQLVERLRAITQTNEWPPPPTQTEIVTRGIEYVVTKLEQQRGRPRAKAG
jgi:hypothetical protein